MTKEKQGIMKGYSPSSDGSSVATNGYQPQTSGSDTYGYSPSKTAATTTGAPKPPKSQ